MKKVIKSGKSCAKGGKVKHSDIAEDKALIKKELARGKKQKKLKHGGKVEGERAKVRLDKYARGGQVKKGHKTQVNIMVGADKSAPMMPPVSPVASPAGLPVGGMPMMPPRRPGMKRGGKVKSYQDLDAGAMSGEGRLQKTDLQKNKRK